MFAPHRGNTLIEYSFVGILTLAIVIPCLNLCGNSLAQYFQHLKSGMKNQVNTASTIKEKSLKEKDAYLALESIRHIENSKQSPCLSTAGCYDAANTSSETIQTLGGRGDKITKDYASKLNALADTLMNDPSADQNLINFIRNLAKSGHSLGNHEAEIITNCPPGKGCVSEYASLGSQLETVGAMEKIFASDYENLKKYLNTHPESLNSKSQDLIDQSSTVITGISKKFNSASIQTNQAQATGGWQQDWDYKGDAQSDVVDTHINANQICNSKTNDSSCTSH